MERMAAYVNILELATAWRPGRGVCRLVVGPSARADAEREAHFIRLTADNCDMLVSEIADPENTADRYRIMIVLNGNRAQMIEFAQIMISLTASPSAR